MSCTEQDGGKGVNNDHVIVDIIIKGDNKIREDDVQLCPDGGWGWVACMGAFFIQFMMLGIQNAAGIIYTALVDEFQTPRGVTGRMTSIYKPTTPIFYCFQSVFFVSDNARF